MGFGALIDQRTNDGFVECIPILDNLVGKRTNIIEVYIKHSLNVQTGAARRINLKPNPNYIGGDDHHWRIRKT